MASGGEFADWLQRGQAHQQAGRPIDAMLCYRRAARVDPKAGDAWYALAEVLWQLGQYKEAVDAWRQAAKLAPNHVAPHFALAEASLALGEVDTAHAAALRVLALQPEAQRAQTIAAIAAMAKAPPVSAEAAAPLVIALMGGLRRDPTLLTVSSLADPLASALERTSREARAPVLSEIVALVRDDARCRQMPSSLLALCCEFLGSTAQPEDRDLLLSLFSEASGRAYAASEHDALRRMAAVARRLGVAHAGDLAAGYAQGCSDSFVAGIPLLWPRRSAGAKLRVIVLVDANLAGGVRVELDRLLSLPREGCEFTLAVMTDGSAENRREPDLRRSAGTARTLSLSAAADAADARRVAALDADLLVDCVGLDGATGPLLAQRPARHIVTLAQIDAPNAKPLIDEEVSDMAAALALIDRKLRELGSLASAPLAAAALSALWDDAVRTHQRGERELARAAYDALLEVEPAYAPALYLRGAALRDEGARDAARASFDAAVAAAPRMTEARLAAVHAAIDAADIEIAGALCEEGLRLKPGEPALLRAFGRVWLARQDGATAAAVFAQALAVAPTDAEAHFNQGVALQMTHQREEALRAYQRALSIDPTLVAADYNIGVIFQEQGRVDAAVAAFENVLRRDPRHVPAHKALGEALLGARRIDEWLKAFRRFEANCPRALPLAVQALEACPYLADYPALDRYLDRLRKDDFTPSSETELADCLEELLYLLLYFDVDAEMLLGFYRTYNAVVPRVYGVPMPLRPTRGPGRIRIGYLSADLRNHVMGKMMWEVVQHHDRERFDVFFYSLSAQSDEWTDRYRQIATRFEVVSDLSERDAAMRIAADDLDLLVDLSTHTRGAKPGILALKPARVQVTHVASAGALGMDAIDFKLTDSYADLSENQRLQIEPMLVMEGCVYPYRHIEPAKDHPFQRERLGIAPDAMLLGAFVNPLKLSRRCLALWREVLERIPRALLTLSPLSVEVRSVYARLLDTAGIPLPRVVMLPQGRSEAENQARYSLIDFVLDPMPFGGVNGTLEALDMGVPVVTLCGARHGERTTFSILTNLGVTETIAHGGGEYLAIATRLASDVEFATGVRDSIRRQLVRSPLTDMRQHTRNLEDAYLRALAERSPAVLEREPT